jgi:hypothetical protein
MYSMYLNGEGIQIIHQPAAHTDGDVIVVPQKRRIDEKPLYPTFMLRHHAMA